MMKISLMVTGAIVLIAVFFGVREDRRLEEAEVNLKKAAAMMAEKREADQKASEERRKKEREEMVEKVRNSSESLISWLKDIEAREKRDGKFDEAAMRDVLERLGGMSTQEAGWILGMYLNGKGMGGGKGTLLFNACMTRLAADAPWVAIDFVERFRKKWKDWAMLREMSPQIVGDAVISMAKLDPAKAVEWLETKGKDFDEQISEHTKRVMLFHVAKENPAKALSLIGELGMKERGIAVAAIVRAAGTDEERMEMLEIVRDFSLKQTDQSARNEIRAKSLAAFGEALVGRDPETADRWITEGKLSDEEKDDLVKGISENFELRQSGDWIEWIGKTASPRMADEQVRRLFASWTENDYGASGKWLVGMRSGPVKEMAVQAYAETAAKYDPVTAGQWAETLPEGDRKNETVRKIHENWPEDVEGKDSFGMRHRIE